MFKLSYDADICLELGFALVLPNLSSRTVDAKRRAAIR